MSTLYITCFQAFDFRVANKAVAFRSAKGRALLVYLAVEQGTHQRSALAGLLWPDLPDARARRNLTQTLLEVRKAISDTDKASPFLLVTHQSIAFNPDCSYQLDVAAFSHAFTTDEYGRAADLYQGEFLAGFELPDSDLFEAWMQNRRGRYLQQAIEALSKLSAQQEASGQLDDALQSVRRILELAPWQEEAHCQLMRLLARNGQRSAALAQYDTLTQMLMDELGVAPAPETNALYDQILAGKVEALTAPAPVASTAKRDPPFQAPAPPPHFVGRTTEIETLLHGLTQSDSRIWALVGMGGLGKTTLAMHVAHLLRNDFVDGVLWANTATSQPIDILNQWGVAFGYNFSGLPDLESRAAAVRGMLVEKSILLVLDNVDAADAVRPLLPGHATCGVLLTTRNLDVAHALNAEALPLGELSPENGASLLRQILGAERVDAEPDAVAQICKVLHYLPLALEITAQRLKSRTRVKLSAMAKRLSQEGQRLGLEISDRAVRTSFEVSWDGLGEDQQRIFVHLALFGGRSLTVDALAYVVDEDPFDVEDLLYGLVALSLLQEEGESHFRQHPLLADFAGEKLGDREGVSTRFADYFYDFATLNQANFGRLDPEWDNIMAAMQSAHMHARTSLVLAYSEVLAQPWRTRARFGDARRGHNWAYQAAKKAKDEGAIAMTLLRWGEACLEQNDYSEAQEHLNLSLAHGMNLEDDRLVATAHAHLARIAIDQSQYKKAEELINSTLYIWQIVGDERELAAAQFRKARLYFDRNELLQAKNLLADTVERQEKIEDIQGMIPTLRLSAQLAAKQGEYDLAHGFCERARSHCERTQDFGELATVYYTLAIVHRRQERYAEARRAAEQALPIFRRLGLRRLEGMTLYQLSAILKELGEIKLAIQHNLCSIELFVSVENNLGRLFSLVLLGDQYSLLQKGAEANLAWQDAHGIATAIDHEGVLSQLQERIG